MSLLSVSSLSAAYGSTSILKDISFAADSGTIVGILGENASGKTTLFKSIAGILPHSGSCELNGRRIEGLSARQIARLCSYIPQRSGISIEISALDVVLMGFNPRLRLLEQPGPAMIERARKTLASVGLGGLEEKNYLSLSEGQKQLCILARTLVSDAALLLLDEPESALDFRYRHRMLQILRQWIDEGERCAVVSLHDPMLALNSCDRILLLHGGTIAGEIHPGADDLQEIEEKLSMVYGCVSLHRLNDRSGNSRFAMLMEEAKPWNP